MARDARLMSLYRQGHYRGDHLMALVRPSGVDTGPVRQSAGDRDPPHSKRHKTGRPGASKAPHSIWCAWHASFGSHTTDECSQRQQRGFATKQEWLAAQQNKPKKPSAGAPAGQNGKP